MIGMDGLGRPFFFLRRLAMSPGAPKYADAPDSRTPRRFRTRGHPPTPSSALRYVDAPNLQGHPSTNSPKSPSAPKREDAPSLQGYPNAQTSPDSPIALTFPAPRHVVVFMRNSAFSVWMSSSPQACGCHRMSSSCKGRGLLQNYDLRTILPLFWQLFSVFDDWKHAKSLRISISAGQKLGAYYVVVDKRLEREKSRRKPKIIAREGHFSCADG